MSSEDPRERADMCGRELVTEGSTENLSEKYDGDTWYEDDEGRHFCRRDVWDSSDNGLCIWHAEGDEKLPEILPELRSQEAMRLDNAVFSGLSFPEDVGLPGYRLRNADFSDASFETVNLADTDLRGANLNGAGLWAADLSDARLQRADLRETGFGEADLTNAELRDAKLNEAHLVDATLTGANLQAADLTDAFLWRADLDDANFVHANLTDAGLRSANLSNANLEHADLSGVGLEDADIEGCKLYATTIDDTTIDESTDLGDKSGYELEADRKARARSGSAGWVSTRLRGFGRALTNSEPLRKAGAQYRTIQRLNRENDLKQDLRFEIHEKHARRKQALAERRFKEWFKLAFYRWPMGYGEKPRHVVGTSLVVIVASALMYQLFGPLTQTPAPDDAAMIGGTLLSTMPITLPEWLAELLTSFYFSVVTFTTLGSGDLQPANGVGQTVATLESFLGALLMALLVFVLGRRATW